MTDIAELVQRVRSEAVLAREFGFPSEWMEQTADALEAQAMRIEELEGSNLPGMDWNRLRAGDSRALDPEHQFAFDQAKRIAELEEERFEVVKALGVERGKTFDLQQRIAELEKAGFVNFFAQDLYSAGFKNAIEMAANLDLLLPLETPGTGPFARQDNVIAVYRAAIKALKPPQEEG